MPNYHSRADYLLYLTREGGAAGVRLHAAVLRLIYCRAAAIIAAILVNPYVKIFNVKYEPGLYKPSHISHNMTPKDECLHRSPLGERIRFYSESE